MNVYEKAGLFMVLVMILAALQQPDYSFVLLVGLSSSALLFLLGHHIKDE